MKTKRLAWLAITASALIFGGCSTFSDSKSDTSGASVSEGSGAQTAGANQGNTWTGNPLDDPSSLLSSRVVYFEFDKSEIQVESMEMLRTHAKKLNSDSNLNVRIEGHADERGSREYNIALGERRAEAIQRFFEAEGVYTNQLTTISYGEERPDDFGHSEGSLAKNRRGVLVY